MYNNRMSKEENKGARQRGAATIAEENPGLVGEQGDQGMWPC